MEVDDEVLEDLETVDAALMRLRRLWSTPGVTAGARAGGDGAVELSTVLVVDAVARSGPATRCGVADVARCLDVAPSTASRLVDRAVVAGVVRRGVSATDARRAELRLTDRGRDLHEQARRYRTDYLSEVLQDWTPSGIGDLADRLAAFADAVRDAQRREPGT